MTTTIERKLSETYSLLMLLLLLLRAVAVVVVVVESIVSFLL